MSNVYVIQAEGGPVKVGVANDPAARLAVLKTGSPYPLSIAHVLETGSISAFAVERASHQILQAFHLHGEWFSACASEAIAAVKAAYAELSEVASNSLPLVRPRMSRRAMQACDLPAPLPNDLASVRAVRDVSRGPFRDLEPVHLHQARLLLGWSQAKLGKACGLSPPTIGKFEALGMDKTSLENIDKISNALSAAGIEFFDGGEPGVRLRKVSAG